MQQDRDQVYRFGEFRLEPAERRLLRNGETISLTPKAFDTLVFLVERAGHLVEKEELMKALWPDSFVEDTNLAQQVFTLRKVLGETDEGGQFIETVARKGFRFVAPVTITAQPEQVSAESLSEAAKSTRPPTWRSALIAVSIIGLVSLAAYALYHRNSIKPTESAQSPANVAQVKTIAVLPFKPLSPDSRNESLELGMTETLITHLSNLK